MRMLALLAAFLLVTACNADTDQVVVVHAWDPASQVGDPWVGLIWETSDDGEVLFLAEPTAPLGLEPWTPMGFYVHDELQISAGRGLHLVTDSEPDGSSPGIEMVWTSGLGNDGSAELDSAIERKAVRRTSFHLDCFVSDTATPAVAVVGGDLDPVQAWKVEQDMFVEVLPIHVECTAGDQD